MTVPVRDDDANCASGAGGPVPTFGFQADGMTAQDNVAAWREAVATLFDVDEPAGDRPDPFRADFVSYAMGSAVLAVARANGQRFRRTLDTIARSGIDHVIVQYFSRGGFAGTVGDKAVTVGAGDVCVLDLAQTVDIRTTDFESLTLFVPRPRWAMQLADPGALNGLVLPRGSVVGAAIGRHLQTLTDLAPSMALSDCEAIVEGSVRMIAAYLRPALRTDADRPAAGSGDVLIHIKRHIEAFLDQKHLSGDTITAHFGLSRAALYRIFTPYGGVATYIRSRRLHRAFFDLSLPRVLVREVAERWHLGSEENFTRAFKAAYGITPKMARTVTLASHDNAASTQAAASQFSRWMRNIAPPAPAGADTDRSLGLPARPIP